MTVLPFQPRNGSNPVSAKEYFGALYAPVTEQRTAEAVCKMTKRTIYNAPALIFSVPVKTDAGAQAPVHSLELRGDAQGTAIISPSRFPQELAGILPRQDALQIAAVYSHVYGGIINATRARRYTKPHHAEPQTIRTELWEPNVYSVADNGRIALPYRTTARIVLAAFGLTPQLEYETEGPVKADIASLINPVTEATAREVCVILGV